MELLDRYLQAVRFWLPKAQQQDIIAELSEDLHSQIDDQETELGRPLNKSELEAILKRCGSPIVVASRYRPQAHLIGPALFPIYQFVLKTVLLWILVPVFIVIIGPLMILPAANRVGALLETLSTLWSALFVAAGIITLIFAVLERTEAKLQLFEKWNVRSLPPLAKRSQPSRTQSVFELAFGIIGLVWLLAIPYSPFLVFGPAAVFLKPAPMWHSFYLPMVLLALFGLAHQCVSLLRPQWTWFPSLARLITTGLTMIVLYAMVSVAFQSPNGAWHPFVVLANAVHDSGHYARLVGIVNASILLALAVVWFGLAIAAMIQTWECMQQVRKRTPQVRDPALLRML